ncbi:MAG: hypothetical protein COV70_02265 [Parcubacteria group bacterium CG11_big_fil_rev_8_21_14_0_20_39_22]|nr:MAG: hypothetical protein COV70_02265 [Parcubacteria group bacterium CG11_big_fil_rev_8_21_14_0_20_39_22]
MPREKVIEYLTPEEIRSRSGYLNERFKSYKGDASSMAGICIIEKILKSKKLGKQSLKILDIGAGNGQFGFRLKDSGFLKIYGIDIDDYRPLEIKEGDTYLDFQLADLNLEKIPYGDNFFDLATSWCVLPHLENPHSLIREVDRTIKPQGVWIFSMPNITSLNIRKKFLFKGDIDRFTETNNHISIFTPALIKKTILKYFNLIEIDYIVDDGVYKGRLGWLKKIAINKKWFGQKKFKKWFGTNVIYIVSKY